MSKVIRIISASVMLTVLSAIILAGCGNRHSDKAGLNKSDINQRRISFVYRDFS